MERILKGSRPSPLELIVGPDHYAAEIARNALEWAAIVIGIGGLGLLAAHDVAGMSSGGAVAVVGLALVMFVAMAVVGRRGARLFYPLVGLAGSAATALVVWVAGPNLQASAVLIPTFISASCLFFTRRHAVIATVVGLGGYGLVISLASGYSRPVGSFLFVLATTLASALMIGRFVANLERLAVSERELHAEVAAARTQLETRVTEQVEEIDRLGRLRRFLSPQVADTVLSTGGDDMLATHRRQIAVIFLDLRGFTAFSAVAEPEDVVEALSEFYAAVGEVVKQLDATVGGFAGDGVMAYFNDPFPCEDPAGKALDMALSLRDPMALLKDRWRDRGFVIGYGAGVAYGYATLGTIGFEERTDYTPIGSVVNLASRLCDEAADGEVLLDSRAHTAVRERITAETTQLDLKGFGAPVTAYRVRIS